MMKSVAFLAAGLVLAAALPAAAQDPGYSLEAWCTGGVAGINNRASIAGDGTIRAINGITEGEWPVVAVEPQLAAEWIPAALGAATATMPTEPPEASTRVDDAILCGLDLHYSADVSVPVTLPAIHAALIAYVPPR